MAEDTEFPKGEEAPVLDAQHAQPYAFKSVRVFFLLIFILAIISFGIWFIFFKDAEMPSSRAPAAPQLPAQEAEEAPGEIYMFFYNMFQGIHDGLEDSPHNLENVDYIDDVNIETGPLEEDVEAVLAVKDYAEMIAAVENEQEGGSEFKYALKDILDSAVIDRSGRLTGRIHDILVNAETGRASALIVQENDTRLEKDLASIRFKKVLKQTGEGKTLLTVAEEKIERKPEFRYTKIPEDQKISLRHLEDGQVLDYKGDVAGHIETVIYQDAQAQDILFTLRPMLARKDLKQFTLPFEKVDINKARDGYDIHLSEKQTEYLARLLFDNNTE